MAKAKEPQVTYVVLGTNTNHEDSVYGPFGSVEEAQAVKFSMGGNDHLHEFKVLELLEAPAEEAEEEEEVEEE